jgi:hypothetical protein
MADRDDGRHEIRRLRRETLDPREIQVLHEIQVPHESLHSSRWARQSQAETGSVTAVLPDKARGKGIDTDKGTDRADMGGTDKGKAVG